MQRLSHVIEGEGDPLLLIHGMGSASTAWKLVKPELKKQLTGKEWRIYSKAEDRESNELFDNKTGCITSAL